MDERVLHPVIASREVTRYILQTFGLHTKKKFGQNFLINEKVVRGIAEAAKIGPGDLVLEVGPGIGTLTQALAETGADVRSVEIDKTLLPVLAKTLEGYENVKIIPGDILKVDLKEITEGRPFTVAANLPYYITTPIIFALLEQELPLNRFVVMVQKEVAERMVAKPGGKDYGPLSLALQYYSEPKLAIPVPARDFMPAPKVDSMVVVCEKREKPAVDVSSKVFFKVVRAAFSQRRKMLSNCLKSIVPEGHTAEELLLKAGIDKKRRGESLSMEEFGHLARTYEVMLHG
ncbi:MAG: 16S rRNA (adenine(1518)-N(6)/adenine(1519)-N(6))-dimethyltransferase RsmA [Acidaminococcus sp.]|jgi:16S rRNA (adenine1518-N6/adenine1519-N6)-dimethyltransferase|nr:16S rRNA (adenine(1518)-N(6)/adenine(1519)-N(6))-dimethyltransferase RsmA [Acidaminococcus sp.]MCI2099846.1 16S rRNA (adenine(1518)-N(6)/adenine(1519)-N(6))-dimethyltransferase RsmA [Acidaminococcus sp.]MCI2114075.1 16S rRNA (adenine(1518)-N(6)/adenine(1519)-N(6))-dimethyltransferase RsmA [Acidaminococcus sp.]MCI2115945.1 16S rRNA (adenine(1518)-N(6)/adenine(1519)-N(6))-dimethyltransferase RsmA [Acidaminococcus sp.]